MDKALVGLEEQLEEEKRKSDLIQKVSFELTKLSSLSDKLTNILELLDTSFNLSHTILLVPEKEGKVLKVLASRGFSNDGLGLEIPFNYGLAGTVAMKKKKVRVSRLSQFRRYVNAYGNQKELVNHIPDYPALPNAESQVVLPLIVNDELVAILSCESENILFFSQKEEDLLMILSQQIALSIQNSMVYEQLEQRVKSRTQELDNLNQTKDHLFSIIAHDLRSPMIALEGVAELIEYYGQHEQYDRLLALGPRIGYTVQNLTQLLDNLLNWSLSQKEGLVSKPVKVEVFKLLKEVEGIFDNLLKSKRIQLTITNCEGHFIQADYNMLFSVFRNLMSNAIKFTQQGGAIDISSQRVGNEIHMMVKDTGMGIEPERLTKIFSLSSHQRTLGTDRERGSGLGLVLVHEFLRLTNGSIRMQSVPGQGTIVHLSLPAS